VGSLKLLQDFYTVHKSPQTSLRFLVYLVCLVCLVCLVGLVGLVRRRGKSVMRETAGRVRRAGGADGRNCDGVSCSSCRIARYDLDVDGPAATSAELSRSRPAKAF
jgi:hypothetical protein